MGRMFLGIIAGVVLVPICLLGWFWFGKVPVAVADPPIPHERMITGIPLHARIDRELVKKVPIMLDEDNLVAGAHVYREQCSVCHGFHGKPASIGTHMFPAAPQLWERHNNSDVVGVSDDAPGETYWKVVNGIRLTGMPAYKSLLTDSEIWNREPSLILVFQVPKSGPGVPIADTNRNGRRPSRSHFWMAQENQPTRSKGLQS